MHVSLASFIRSELKATRSNQDRFLSRHVRTCEDSACPFPNCMELRMKLNHFDKCENPTCMACAAARFTWLATCGLVSPMLSQQFVSRQADLMQYTLELKRLGLSLYELEVYRAKRAAFNSVLHTLYQTWILRFMLVQRNASSAMQQERTVCLTMENVSTYRDWEQTVSSQKRARFAEECM